MLFIENKTLSYAVNGPKRIQLLEKLQEKDLIPLIRSARLNCFDRALLGPGRIAEMESAIASWTESENLEPYVRGDVFCLSDHVFFLVFDDNTGDAPLIRAGIVYEAGTDEPFRKLDSFCRDVREFFLAQGEAEPGETQPADDFPEWQHGKPSMPKGFKRFVAKQDIDSLYTSLRKETIRERIRAASMLEDPNVRAFLRRAKEAHVEGYAAKLLTGETIEAPEFSIEKLEDAGLVEREVQVSCRKTGHAMFRLPNAHALAVVTVSDAMCSECGSAVADEKVEEVIAPTQLASSLLEDGSWLVSRLHYFLREMGVPESEIAIGPSERDGHGQMMANICGESFLLVARDGDLSPAFARRAIDLEIETEASHLVVVATGRVHNQARVLLQEHSRRRVVAGRDFELILTDGAAAAARELRYAFERVSQRVVAEQVCELDSFIGLSLSRIIITKFKLQRRAEEFGNHALLSGESTGSVARPPLTLAARASANSPDVLQHNDFFPDEPNDGTEPDSVDDDAGTGLNSGTHG
jgi:hypothetical protein